MTSASRVLSAVAQQVSDFVEQMHAETSSYGEEALRFVSAAAARLEGGKLMRARFCHAGWQAVAHTSGTVAEPVSLWKLCAALEIFQAAALVHDDIIDRSDTRRGRPAAHRALEAEHRTARWHGDAEQFGTSSAVLLGDLLVAWSDDLLEDALRSLPEADAVRGEYARMRRDVTTGQFLDLAEEAAWVTAPIEEHAQRALRVVALKSARYSVAQPLALGALLAGASPAQLDALRAFGQPLGMAYQLRDDVLGVFGDSAVTGKPSGDDLREGKRTVLIAYTREAVTSAARSTVDELLGDPSLTAEQITMLQSTITASGALQRVEDAITEYAESAIAALTAAPLDNRSVNELRELTRNATQRQA